MLIAPFRSGPGHAGWGNAPALHRAAYAGDTHRLRAELERGSNPNQEAMIPWTRKDYAVEESWSPLALAVMGGRLDAVRVLLEGGAAPDTNSMSRAIYQDLPVMVELLIAHGADPNQTDVEWQMGRRVLHVAADRSRDGRVVELLLKAGADPRAVDDVGETPIHSAANGTTARALLTAGAAADAAAHGGAIPLHTAAARGNDAVVVELLRAGSPVDPRISGVTVFRWAAGSTPLLLAVSHGGTRDTVRKLLDAGADPSTCDDAGRCVCERARESLRTARTASRRWERTPKQAQEILQLIEDALERRGRSQDGRLPPAAPHFRGLD